MIAKSPLAYSQPQRVPRTQAERIDLRLVPHLLQYDPQEHDSYGSVSSPITAPPPVARPSSRRHSILDRVAGVNMTRGGGSGSKTIDETGRSGSDVGREIVRDQPVARATMGREEGQSVASRNGSEGEQREDGKERVMRLDGGCVPCPDGSICYIIPLPCCCCI